MNKSGPDCQVSPEYSEIEHRLENNHLLASFLDIPEHFDAYRLAMDDSSPESLNLLDRLFKEFYFDIRFTSYISSMIYFNAINFDKRQRMHTSRYSLTLDAWLRMENDMSFVDMVSDPKSIISLDALLMGHSLPNQVTSPILYAALQTLTPNQLQILEFSYVKGLSDTAIGTELCKSQQAVSKSRKRALEALRHFINEANP